MNSGIPDNVVASDFLIRLNRNYFTASVFGICDYDPLRPEARVQ